MEYNLYILRYMIEIIEEKSRNFNRSNQNNTEFQVFYKFVKDLYDLKPPGHTVWDLDASRAK